MTSRDRSIAICALIVAGATAALSLAPAARAGTATYMSTDVPKTIDDGETAVSKLYGPENLPPVIDLEIVGVRVAATAAGGAHSDKFIDLRSPNERDAILLGAAGGCALLGFDITYDDQAATAFNNTTDCIATGTRRPVFGTVASLFAGDDETGPRIEGFWELTFTDTGTGPIAPPARLSSWGLRATFAPMNCSASGEKQKLRKKLEVEVKCDADASVTTSGDAKRRTFNAHSGADDLKVPLKRKARRRLDGGGKAKIKLEATNELGDVVPTKAKFRVTD